MTTANRNKNYRKGTGANLDYSRERELKQKNSASIVSHGDSVMSYYMDKFYHEARGHLLNKYHVGMWGDLVREALRIMDRNSYADKYTLTNVKSFKSTGDPHIKTSFNNWADLFYSKESHVLNMYWAAQTIKMGASKAKTDDIRIDTTKSMKYPVVLGDDGPKTLTLTVLDDPYNMWFQFFNALYNAQFSPLVLKARNTWQRMVIAVDVYNDATTTTRSSNWGRATETNPFITDVNPIQMFEFNSCILMGAPEMSPSNTSDSPFTFTVTFKYPNAFQGTFKNQLRYLRDNSVEATDKTAINYKQGGTFYRPFYEESLYHVNNRGYLFEAFNPTEYYKKYGERYFKKEDE